MLTRTRLGSFGHATSNMQQQNILAAGLAGVAYPELALLSNLGSLMGQQQYHEQEKAADDDRGARGGGRTRSGDSRSSSAYASRHQAAEQRRRNRINERLELLRKLVPHAERANTACFLEEVIKYVENLQNRNAALERMIRELQAGSAAGGTPAPVAAQAAAAVTNPTASMPGLAISGPTSSEPQRAASLDQLQLIEHKENGGATSPAAGAVQQRLPLAAPAAPAAASSAAPSTSQALMGLQGLLPEGVDVQTLLQQALINAQAQLLQQHQQHQAALAGQGANSGGAPTASGGAANSFEQQQARSDRQQQQQQQRMHDARQQQSQQHGVLQPAPDLVLQPPADQQASILSALAVGSQTHQDMFGAAPPAVAATSPNGGLPTTLPPELQKLKAHLDSHSAAAAAGGNDLAMAAGFAGSLQSTAPLLAAAPSLSLSTGGAGLPGASSGPGSLHMGRSQLLAAAAAAANGSGMGGMNGAAFMAGLSAVAAAGAADNAAAIAVAERANSMASGHEEGEEGENAVPHKKRKMLVL